MSVLMLSGVLKEVSRAPQLGEYFSTHLFALFILIRIFPLFSYRLLSLSL